MDTDEVLAKLDELAALPEVRYTSPVLATEYPAGMVLTYEFSVKFETDVSRNEIDELNEAHGVEIAGLGGAPNNFDLDVINPKELPPLGCERSKGYGRE